jgi:hypothetical protein
VIELCRRCCHKNRERAAFFREATTRER